ncbi:putative transcriptional regulator, MerR family [Arthrobacter sp. PAMC 25486]|uniref:transcriptional regulator FtsR n=1 Tax=Arthrobacter sp. PAMC 25486 TaxID=1494608 RepID=UPI000535A1E2|nr:MerR family transcriptional regulator [Arthrobacter sp. PAMC 25486]AIX99685.1 putative transcriptional regulator, MerR family [Arthrobacter sp. PAMC 25486]
MNSGAGRRLVDVHATNRRAGAAAVLNIGEVLALLCADFPSVTASKIRFYEEKGLITPQRTPAGYRQFREPDVERLRFVLALQRDHYLPLKVIGEYLAAIDQGRTPANLPPGVSIAPRMVSDELANELKSRARRLTPEQLRTESGADEQLYETMLSFGLLELRDGGFDDHALKVAQACTALAAHGLEPRHLRPFQAAAEREFGLVERAVGPVSAKRDGTSVMRAAETAREIAEQCLSLHSALVHARIAEMEAP